MPMSMRWKSKESWNRSCRPWKGLGFHGDFVEHLPLPFPVAGAVRVHNQAQFHPLKFVCCLAKGLHIYEHTRCRSCWHDRQ